MRKILLFILFLILISPVYALGVSPGMITANFEAGWEQDFDVVILNLDGDTPITVETFIDGNEELLQYITLETERVTLPARGTKKYVMKVRLPQEMTPGLHVVYYGAHEQSENEAFVGAVVKVAGRIEIFVPYPAKYLEAKDLKIGSTEVGKDTTYEIKVINRGEQAISSITGTLSAEGVATQSLSYGAIETYDSAIMEGIFPTSGLGAGEHTAIYSIEYGGDELLTGEFPFLIGDLNINILVIEPTKLKANTINKVDVEVKSYWNDGIRDIEIKLSLNEKQATSQTFSLAAMEQKKIPVYIDTTGMEPGEYKATAQVSFADKIVTKDFDITISAFALDTNYIILIAVIVMMGLAIFFFVTQRKKLNASPSYIRYDKAGQN